MKAINVHEAKTQLSGLLSAVERGQAFRICRNGDPIADLVPYKKHKRTEPHPMLGKVKIDYDATEDVTDEEWGEVA